MLMRPAIRGGEVPPVKNVPGGGEVEVGAAGDKGMKVVVVVVFVVGGGAGFTPVDAVAAEGIPLLFRGNRVEGGMEKDMAGGQELESLRAMVTFRPNGGLLLALKNSDKG